MRDIKFEFLYKGLPFQSGNDDCNWFKKVYTLNQLIEKPLSKLSDVHGQSELIAKRQFTGLKDKNGVGIYEGDILSFHVDWVGQPAKQVVYSDGFHTYALLSTQEREWLEKGSNHYKYWKEDEDNVYFLNQCDNYDVEIIGNIHQNPELITEPNHD